MPKNGPLSTPFEQPLVSTPSGSDGTLRDGTMSLNEGASSGLVSTPFQSPMVTAPGTSETANTSELPPHSDYVGGIPDAPAPGSQVDIAGKVASPWKGSTVVDGINK